MEQGNRWRGMTAAAALMLLSPGVTEAADCSRYAAKRLEHFEQLARRAVTQCVRRDAGACPDARATKRLDATAARIARSVVKRCRDVPIVDELAAARARAVCEVADVCGVPRTITVSVGAGAATTSARASSAGAGAVSDRTLRANAGWTGLAHDLAILEGASFTAELADCDGESDTLCTLRGATAGTPFGAPSPLSAGGVTFCLDIEFQSDIDGAYDLASGALTYDAAVRIGVFNGRTIDQPCPACVPVDEDPQLGEAGTCVGGQHAGTACVVEGLGAPSFGTWRATSRTCGAAGPGGSGAIAVFETRASATTDAFEMAPLPDGPPCANLNFRGETCPCGTCADASNRACRSDDDCTRPDGTTSVCGRACVGGPDDGTRCSSPSQCSSGFCSIPRGEPTARNACFTDDESSGPGTCTSTGDADGGGVCLAGPMDTICAIARHRGCISDAECPAGDHCTMELRRCHPDVIELEGTPEPPVNGVSEPTLVGGFCMAPAGIAAVNYAAGFPGPVTYVWPTEVRLGQ